MKANQPFNDIRWAARVIGTLLVIFTLVFGIANFIYGLNRTNGSPLASFSTLIIIIFIIWGFALAGLVVALWKEGLGGCISLVGFLLMYILNLFNADAPNRWGAILVFLIFSIPSLLYLYYWRMTRDILKKDSIESNDGKVQ
jgi:hypothetical protein